jgi:hypothetical protein
MSAPVKMRQIWLNRPVEERWSAARLRLETKAKACIRHTSVDAGQAAPTESVPDPGASQPKWGSLSPADLMRRCNQLSESHANIFARKFDQQKSADVNPKIARLVSDCVSVSSIILSQTSTPLRKNRCTSSGCSATRNHTK